MSETVKETTTEPLEHFRGTLQALGDEFQRQLLANLESKKIRTEAERAFFMDILNGDPQRWTGIFLGGKTIGELTLEDANTIFTEVRKLFRDCILSGGSLCLRVSEEQVGMPLREVAAMDTAVKSGWMQTSEQNGEAKAGHLIIKGANGKLQDVGPTDSHFLELTQEGLRLLKEWTARFGQPPEHQFVRALADEACNQARQAAKQTLA